MSAEGNFIQAKEYAEYLKQTEPAYSPSEVQTFIPLLETFVDQLRIGERQPSNDPLIKLWRERLLQNAQALLNFNKIKQAILSIHPPDRSLPPDARASFILEKMSQLDALIDEYDLYNDKGTWVVDRINEFRIANFIVLDKTISSYRGLIELSVAKQDTKEMEKLNKLARNKFAYTQVKLRDGIKKLERQELLFEIEVRKHMPKQTPSPSPKQPEIEQPSTSSQADKDLVKPKSKNASGPTDLAKQIEENVNDQMKFFRFKTNTYIKI
jgi:hypothetical protein